MMEKQNVAVYGDLTALFSARSKLRKQINYENLDKVLKKVVGLEEDESYDLNSFYTLFDSQNEKQVSFVNGLRELGWNVSTTNSRDIRRGLHPTRHRFDADIAYDIGLNIESFNKILVVSDSFDLLRTLDRYHDDAVDCEINMTFFLDALDMRWWPKISGDSYIKFTDLNTELQK